MKSKDTNKLINKLKNLRNDFYQMTFKNKDIDIAMKNAECIIIEKFLAPLLNIFFTNWSLAQIIKDKKLYPETHKKAKYYYKKTDELLKKYNLIINIVEEFSQAIKMPESF